MAGSLGIPAPTGGPSPQAHSPVQREEPDIYLTDDATEAEQALDRAIAWSTDPDASRELRTLAKTLSRGRSEILAHHATGASNGRDEAANLTIKQVKRSG